ncbi:IclR family transcriptional regulator [Paraburkholderia sp. BL17N1]|uniref:IclR family transcriptional regulator n=1 Tax=Paraburkholderia sp. BL17N1 TaxID=1938798 RepID=UPI000F1F10A4|nr:IclR family transcriptional regulator [Paraburkholderia sp. BL17N1]RKR45201.1 IclR family transcriptional regulator [Paraburkholderia sp. BL17N1]
MKETMRSVQRILAVFESFSVDRTSLMLQEIADRIALPKSTAFRIVQSLEKAGYLVRLEDQQYCLSFQFTRLAGHVRSTLGIREISRPVLLQLADRTRETASLHTLSGSYRICIDAVATVAAPLRMVAQPGEQVPMVAGAGSKVLMAYMPPEKLSAMVVDVARVTRRPRAEIERELEKIRTQGFAVSHGERLLGISAISAPIRDSEDQVRYCISVGAPTVRMKINEDEIVRSILVAAADISRQFGAATVDLHEATQFLAKNTGKITHRISG